MEIRKIKKTDNKSTANLIKKVFEEHNAPKEEPFIPILQQIIYMNYLKKKSLSFGL